MTSVPQTTTTANGATRPVPVSSFDWETGEFTYDASQMDRHAIWRTAVATAATKAYQGLPDSHSRIDKAVRLVHEEAVEMLADETAFVTSSDGTTRYHVNGVCECPDAAKAPRAYCKHRIARLLVVRAREIAKGFGTDKASVTISAAAVPAIEAESTPEPAPEPKKKRTRKASAPVVEPAAAVEAAVVASTATIPSDFVKPMHGKQFVLYAGLLAMAHDTIASLEVTIVSVTPDLALAKARLVTKDGRVFEDFGDASPSNVNGSIAPHYIRMASTRAKARCLRDCLNIGMAAVEELD